MCGVYLNRGRALLVLVCLVVFTPLFFGSKYLLILIRQNEEVVYYADLYIKVMIPALFILAQYDILRKFLNSLNKSFIPMVALIAGSILHIFWCYLFTDILLLEIMGIAYATLITYLTLFIITLLYASFQKDIRAAMFMPNKDSFKDLNLYLKMAFPSMAMTTTDCWVFEIMNLMSSYIGVDSLAAQIILFNIIFLSY